MKPIKYNPIPHAAAAPAGRRHSPLAVTRGNQRGFTLVEILIVIALSALLIGLLIRPLYQALSYTKDAQVETAAQDSARKTMEMITRELGTAAYVFDNTSHPFDGSASPTDVGQTNDSPDRSSNFLNLSIPDTNITGSPVIPRLLTTSTPRGSNSTYKDIILHAYGAKLDFVTARHIGVDAPAVLPQTATPKDPTVNEYIKPLPPRNGGGSATAVDTGIIFPIAPGTTMVRYFVGLENPEKPYNNPREGLVSLDRSDANTYILYRAQFPPFAPAPNNDGSQVNEDLFVPRGLPSPPDSTTQPEYDDPDFFRMVNAGDVNWLSPTHAPYTSGEADAHNTRLEHWMQISKRVIDAPDIDLLLLPRQADGTFDVDAPGAYFQGVPHFGASYDPWTGLEYPIARFSVSFLPAATASEAMASTTTEYTSLGVVSNDAAQQGLPYIPSQYTANSQSWVYPYTVSLVPTPTPSITYYYQTAIAPLAPTVANPGGIAANLGDMLEIRYANTTDPGTLVYNLTTGAAGAGSDYIPMRIDPNTGVINFAMRAMPPTMDKQVVPNPAPVGWITPAGNYPLNANNIFWYFGATDINNGVANSSGVGVDKVDLTMLQDNTGTIFTPLAPTSAAAPAGNQIRHAHVVPGSLQVFGPDSTLGPNLGTAVLFTQVGSGDAIGPNQYQVDYVTGIVTFAPSVNGPSLPVKKADRTTNADPVAIAFDYQANIVLPDDSVVLSGTNAASPIPVLVDYQTRDLLSINIGVRVYNPSTNQAHIVNMNSKVKIGNANR